MLAKNHVPVAAASWALLAPFCGASPVVLLACLPLAALGGLLPDVDHPSSVLGQKLPGVSHLIRLVLGHRGGTHSLLAIALCSWGLWHLALRQGLSGSPVGPYVGSAIASILVGYVSHLAADGLTKSGVPLLWPIRTKFRSPLPFTTGTWIEPIVAWSFVGGVAWHLTAFLR